MQCCRCTVRRAEEVEELKLDLQDVKEMYRQQVSQTCLLVSSTVDSRYKEH